MEKMNGDNPQDDNVHIWQLQGAQWDQYAEENGIIAGGIAEYLEKYQEDDDDIVKIWPPSPREMELIILELDTFADHFGVNRDYFVDAFRIFCIENDWPGNFPNFKTFSDRYQQLAVREDWLHSDHETDDSGVFSADTSFSDDNL